MELIAIKQSLWHLAKDKFWIIDDWSLAVSV
jgi:hypothetical protein